MHDAPGSAPRQEYGRGVIIFLKVLFYVSALSLWTLLLMFSSARSHSYYFPGIIVLYCFHSAAFSMLHAALAGRDISFALSFFPVFNVIYCSGKMLTVEIDEIKKTGEKVFFPVIYAIALTIGIIVPVLYVSLDVPNRVTIALIAFLAALAYEVYRRSHAIEMKRICDYIMFMLLNACLIVSVFTVLILPLFFRHVSLISLVMSVVLVRNLSRRV